MNVKLNNRFLAMILVFVLSFSLLTIPVSAAYSTTSPAAAQVVTERDPLNIRSGAGAQYKVVSQAKKGTYLQIVGDSGSFYKVVYSSGGKTGYASKQYLKIVSTGTAKVVTDQDPLVLRSKASSGGANLAQIPKGAVVPVLGKSGNWYKVVYRNQMGYCSATYLSVNGNASTNKKTTITFSSISNPGTIIKGNGVHISGTIKSTNSKLTSITASIRNSSGKTIVSKTVKPNAYSYKIYDSALDWAMTFGSLSAGSYTLRYDAKTVDGTTSNTSKNFVVKGTDAVPSANIHVYQGAGTSYCTAASAAMLVRADLAVQNKNYSNVTLNSILNRAWNHGLLLDFWIGDAHLHAYRLSGNATEKQEKVNSLLKKHPEGLVLYGWKDSGAQHAVYMANHGKILDPYYNSKRYRNLSESASSASNNWNSINQYWIIIN